MISYLGILKKTKTIRKKKSSLEGFDLEFLLTSGALFSSRIEGNTLDLNSFVNGTVNKKDREYQEVIHLIDAYQLAQGLTLNKKNLLKVHRHLARTLVSKNRQGKFRNEKVGVFDSKGLVYLAVEEKYLETEVNQLFERISYLLEKNMTFREALFWASWIHLVFVLIHPLF